MRAIFEPASLGMLAGEIGSSKLSIGDRAIAKAVGSMEGDRRSWDTIRAWAAQALLST